MVRDEVDKAQGGLVVLCDMMKRAIIFISSTIKAAKYNIVTFWITRLCFSFTLSSDYSYFI